jgi:hypothetical protein
MVDHRRVGPRYRDPSGERNLRNARDHPPAEPGPRLTSPNRPSHPERRPRGPVEPRLPGATAEPLPMAGR